MDAAADIAEAIDALVATGRPACVRVASALGQWRNGGEAVTLEQALGVGQGWRTDQRVRQRDKMLINVARRHFGARAGRPIGKTAGRAMLGAIARYEAGEFAAHRRGGARPAAVRSELLDLLLLGVPIPGLSTVRHLNASVNQDPFGLTDDGRKSAPTEKKTRC